MTVRLLPSSVEEKCPIEDIALASTTKKAQRSRVIGPCKGYLLAEDDAKQEPQAPA